MNFKISIYIIAFNEAAKIAQTIESVRWADEIVVIDSHSTDGTIQIAESLGARVVQVDFVGFGALRNSALDACSHEWVFSLDSDERCTQAARDEIVQIINNPDALDAYFVPRRNFFMGRWIKYSGWYPNYRQPQLFRKDKMSYSLDKVHEQYVLHDAKVGYLKHAIWQLPFKNFEETLNKANRYSTLGATKMRIQNPTMGKALGHGIWSFLKHYVFKLGFLDGWAGFVIAFGNFEGTFYRYAKAFESQQQWQLPNIKP
jgi:glycosyltransferase involved in cell wall biosynthesis